MTSFLNTWCASNFDSNELSSSTEIVISNLTLNGNEDLIVIMNIAFVLLLVAIDQLILIDYSITSFCNLELSHPEKLTIRVAYLLAIDIKKDTRYVIWFYLHQWRITCTTAYSYVFFMYNSCRDAWLNFWYGGQTIAPLLWFYF